MSLKVQILEFYIRDKNIKYHNILFLFIFIIIIINIIIIIVAMMFIKLNVVSLDNAVDEEEHDGSRHHDQGVQETEGSREAVLGLLVEECRDGADSEGQDGVKDGEETVYLTQLLLRYKVSQERPVDNVPHPSLHADHTCQEHHPLLAAGGQHQVVAALTQDGDDADDGGAGRKERRHGDDLLCLRTNLNWNSFCRRGVSPN